MGALGALPVALAMAAAAAQGNPGGAAPGHGPKAAPGCTGSACTAAASLVVVVACRRLPLRLPARHWQTGQRNLNFTFKLGCQCA
jgi:hypothetical protein